MAVKGFIDSTQNGELTGWAFDPEKQQSRQNVIVHIEGRPPETIVADRHRTDLARAKKGDGQCGFVYTIPPGVKPADVSCVFQSNGRPIPPSHSRARDHKTLEYRLRHPLVLGHPEVACSFSQARFSVGDIEISQRLIDAYAHSMNLPNGADSGNGSANRYAGMWSRITNEFHREAVEMLEGRDAPGLARYLFAMHQESLVHGVSQGKAAYEGLQNNEVMRRHVATIYWDRLVSLAEALGCLAVEAPEQIGHWGENMYAQVEDVVERIEKRLQIELATPTVATGLFGIETSKGWLDQRTLDAAYAAFRIQQLVSDRQQYDRPEGSVCEIGPGLGWTAYYAFRLGVRRYTLVDLPIMNVLQGYCLIKALPQANVVLPGEPVETGQPQIRICATRDFDELDLGAVSLFFNQDSFPEIGQANLRRYLVAIGNVPGARLLSINQESEGKSNESEKQMIVHRQIEAAGGFRQDYRFPHWLRSGYVEELFHTTTTKPSE